MHSASASLGCKIRSREERAQDGSNATSCKEPPIIQLFHHPTCHADSHLAPRWLCLYRAYHNEIAAHCIRVCPFLAPQLPRVLTMDARPQRPKRRDATLSSLNTAIEAVNIAKDILSMTPATAALSTVSVILVAIRVGLLPVCFGRLPA